MDIGNYFQGIHSFSFIYLLFKYVNLLVWSKVGHFNKGLSKGAKTTSWIWNLHADAHHFDMQYFRVISSLNIRRQVLSSNLAHISLVFFWISGMLFHGAYLSNYSQWLKDPKHYVPSAQMVWSLIGQHILNSDIGNYFQGIHITSGIFQLWVSQGIMCVLHLKYACAGALLGTIVSLGASYVHIQLYVLGTGFYKKLKTILVHHTSVLFGLRSISWCGHVIHIADPLNHLLDLGIDPVVMPCPQDLLLHDVIDILEPGFSVHWIEVYNSYIYAELIAAHHLYVGIVFIASSVIGSRPSQRETRIAHPNNSWHGQLSINLKFTGSLSIACGHHIYVLPVYASFAVDYPTVICLFYHHMWIAGFLIVGATAHASIFMVSSISISTISCISSISSIFSSISSIFSSISSSLTCRSRSIWSFIQKVLIQRDVIIGHLIWVSIILGLHSLGLYIHNDSLQALARVEDIFDDNSIQLKPLFALVESYFQQNSLDIKIYVVDKKVMKITQELGTADFIVTHIHAFTIHVTLLILSKGILYARNSRLVSDKFQLGFRYPCDGPGRGGTCQISSWDHIFLGMFWMYNAVSVVLFHYYWKMQSDVWCILV